MGSLRDTVDENAFTSKADITINVQHADELSIKTAFKFTPKLIECLTNCKFRTPRVIKLFPQEDNGNI